MKYFISLFTLFTVATYAQDASDALLYSSEYNYGTARYQAMSGAFGALGGDLSAINDNPASSAVFKNSLFSGSMSVNSKNNDISQTTNTNSSKSSLNINQIGGVAVFTNKDRNVNKITFAFNYEQTQNYNNEYYIESKTFNSITNYFLNYANGIPFQDIQMLPGELIEDAYMNIGSELGYNHQQAFLGYYGGIIDPLAEDNPMNTSYTSTGTYNQVNQKYLFSSSGRKSLLDLNMGARYREDLYLGASVKIYNIDNQRNSSIKENGYRTDSDLKEMVFNNNLNSYGTGVSFQVGLIKTTKIGLRLGASLKSPTWYKITDELTQSINSNLADVDIKYIGNEQVNIFESYKLRSPMTLTTSAAYVIGNNGIISVDYHYKDYKNMKLKPTADFNDVNNLISENFNNTSEVNIGGEYKIQRLSLRAGYRFSQNPLKNSGYGDSTGFSLGTGFNFGQSNFDIAYSQGNTQLNYNFYGNIANVNQKRTNIVGTYTYKF